MNKSARSVVRLEALTVIALAAIAGVALAWSGGSPGWQWSLLGAVAVAGLSGLVGLSTMTWRRARSLFVAAAAWVLAAQSGGTSSPFVLWLAAAIVVYAIALSGWWRWAFPIAAAASIPALLAVSREDTALVGVLLQAFLLAIMGVVVATVANAALAFVRAREVAEAQARTAEGRFQAAFVNASSGMAILDSDGVIVEANRALGDLVGLDVGRLAGLRLDALIDPRDAGTVGDAIERMELMSVWSGQSELRLRRGSGAFEWVSLGLSPVHDDTGRSVFAQVHDISPRVRTEEALRLSEEHYRNLFSRSPVAVWEEDFTAVGAWLDTLRGSGISDLRAYLAERPDEVERAMALIEVRDVNAAGVQLLEAEGKESLLGAIPMASATQESLAAVAEQILALWEGRDRVVVELAGRTMAGNRLDGILHWVAPRVNGELDLSNIVVAIADLTEYKRAQEALHRVEERLRTVVSASPIMLFALDEYGVCNLAEGQGVSVMGLTSADMVGRSVFEMFRDSPQMVRAVRRAIAGEAFTTKVEVGAVVFDTRFNPIWEKGKVSGVIGVANDVTEAVRTSQQLEDLIRSKDEFVASVSHELRTPLTAVLGFATELHQNYGAIQPQEAEHYIELIASQSMEVADLVEDLLVAARVDIDNVAVFPESLDLWSQVEGALATWPEELPIELHPPDNVLKAYADPIRVRQIVRNLLSNADRYGGSTVLVTVEQSGETVCVVVKDDGDGIAERDRDSIFEPYHRAHEEASQPGSVGLGLTVSRQLARLMDGDLTYRYEHGWSIFELSLPAS